MSVHYTMEALENYDPTLVAQFAAMAPPLYCWSDQQDTGISFDHLGRTLFYIVLIATADTTVNNTGFTLWDGLVSVAPAAMVDTTDNWNMWVARKDIDTGTVTFTQVYNAANTVPNGIGGGDGTWRRFNADANVFGGSLPILINPRTGDAWLHTQSCFLYFFPKSAGFTQTISPFRGTIDTDDPCYPVGITTDWMFTWEQNVVGSTYINTLHLIPSTLTSDEITADVLLDYAPFDYDTSTNTAFFRQALDHAGNFYVFQMQMSGTRAYKLWKFTPPTSAPFGGPVVGGGFSDITPWAGGTGPNTNAAPYTHNIAGKGYTNAGLFNGDVKNFLYFLPATNDLVCVSKFFAQDTSASTSPVATDPLLMFFDCTYVNLTGPTFDYHHAFVTGYMTADWVSTAVAADAAWSVIDATETNLYLNMSDFDYADVDYTLRWFAFTVQPVVAGVWTPDTTTNHTIFVRYKFVSGSAPQVVKVLDEAGWDAVYTAYAAAIGNDSVVANSFTPQNKVTDLYVTDPGLWDETAQAFFYSGQNNNMYQLNALFTPRASLGANPPNAPFLRLSFAGRANLRAAVSVGVRVNQFAG